MTNSYLNAIEGVDQKYGTLLADLRDIFEGGLLPYEKRSLVHLDSKGQLSINGVVIPYDLLPYVFHQAHTVKVFNSTKHYFDSFRYDIYVEGQRYSYVDHANGIQEFLYEGRRHCTQGPAWIDRELGLEQYFVNGKLHRTNGPAIVNGVNQTEEYALFDKIVSLEKFVENNPHASIVAGMRGQETFSITRWDKYAVVDGTDGTKAFLEQDDGAEDTLDIFLLNLVSRPVQGYKLVRYLNIGDTVSQIKSVVDETLQWQITKNAREIKAFSTDNGQVMSFDRENEKLSITIKNGPPYSRPYIKSGAKGLITTVTYKDAYGRNHNKDGPAVLTRTTMSEKKEHQYFLHGCRLSKERFDAKRYDPNTGCFYWLNDIGEYHSDNIICPSIIYPSGEQRFHFNGLLHHDFLPAIYTPGKNFDIYRCFIYGNEVSPSEHRAYDPQRREIVFRDSNFQCHRDDGPALIQFEKNSFCVKKFFRHGKLHREDGPAVCYSDGSKEFWIDGKCQDQRDTDFLAPTFDRVKITLLTDQKEGLTTKGDNMSGETKESRMSQVGNGIKTGATKGAAKIVTEKVAGSIAEHIPLNEKMPMDKLVQFVLLVMSAELVERAPDGAASKVGLNQNRRYAFGEMTRSLGGEVLGRDATKLFAGVAPMLLDGIQNLTADDINEVTGSLEVDEMATAPAEVVR